jgi:S1-C subfamily serine protease
MTWEKHNKKGRRKIVMSRQSTSGRRILWIFFLSVFIGGISLTVAFPPYALASPSVDLSTTIIRVAKETIPAVVHIEVTERQEVANRFFPFENDPFFRRFFNFPEAPRNFKREVKGIGTGMILDSQGDILTNFHVAGGATKIEVTLASGHRYAGKLVGGDPKTDLAVIRIEAKEKLPHILFGNSDKVEVGKWVVAIENVDPKGPLGQAGLEARDIILAINGQSIVGIDDFAGLVGLLKPKQNVTMVCLDHRTGNTGSIEIAVR